MVTGISFPAPGEVVSINKTNGLHWATRRRLTNPWKEAGYWYSKEVGLARQNVGPCEVLVRLPFKTARRRDPHNYTGTVVKAIIDGMVMAGVWPDDTPDQVSILDPELVVDPSLTVTVTLWERNPE